MSFTTQEAFDIFLISRDLPTKPFSQTKFIENVHVKMGLVFPLSLHRSIFVKLKRYYDKTRAAQRHNKPTDIDWNAVLYSSSMAESPFVVLSEEKEEEEAEERQSRPLAPQKIQVEV